MSIRLKSMLGSMGVWLDLDNVGLMKFARSIERDCQEGVKWERRKLEWILEERRKQAELEKEAAGRDNS